MSDEPLALPSPEPEPKPQPPGSRRQRNLVPWIYTLALVVLALALVWIWQNPNPSPDAIRPEQLTALVDQVTNLTVRIEKLEARPASSAPDLKPLEARITVLTQRLDNLPKAPPVPDLQPLQQRVAALGQQLSSLPQSPDLKPIEAEIANQQRLINDLNQLPTQIETAAQQRAAISARLDSVAGIQQAISKQLDSLQDQVKSQTVAFDQKVAAVQQQAVQVAATALTATRLARLEAARSALIAGQKLGPIDGAPPALTRYADAPPPTEAGLRLDYPASAKAALSASQQQPTTGATFGDRVLSRAQSLITIREGDRVLVGDPTAGILAGAQTRLDAGDLGGAVAELSKLSGPPAQAMAAWLERARSLLAAQNALDSLAAHA